MLNQIFEVPVDKFEALQSKISKLNKRAKKYGCNQIHINVVDEKEKTLKKDSIAYDVRYYEVSITGDAPVLAGYQLIGVVEHVGDEFFVRSAPNESIPKSFWNRQQCDHCGHNRHRKQTYVLKEIASGDHIQVGSTCLKDFFAGNTKLEAICFDAEKFFKAENIVKEFDGEYGNFWENNLHYNLVKLLACAENEIATFGWLSKSKAQWDETPTAVRATVLYDSIYFSGREKPVDNKYMEKAEKIVKWAKDKWLNMELSEMSEFDQNMKAIVSYNACNWKMTGFAVSLCVAYWKYEKEMADLQKSNDNPSEWVGEIKKREDFKNLTVSFITVCQSIFGTSELTILADENGNQFKWYNSNVDGIEKDKTYTIKGTVKAHETYNGVKQTVINRCKVIEGLED